MRAQHHDGADDLLTIEQAAVVLNIQPRSVQRAIWRGALPTVKLAAVWSHRQRCLRRPDVEHYAANRKTWKSKSRWPMAAAVHGRSAAGQETSRSPA